VADHREDDRGVLEDGTWSWRLHSLTIDATATARWGVLHLWLRNNQPHMGVGQPVALVLADARHAYTWSAVASEKVTTASCPDGCRGSLASVAVAAGEEILGHLSFSLPMDATPEHWGLQIGHHAHFRPVS
jgi:hypothetical protein